MIAGKVQVGQEMIDAAPKLKIITACGVGFDHIDVDYASSQGIVVSNCPESVMQPTAEMAFALILALSRKLIKYDEGMQKEHFLILACRKTRGKAWWARPWAFLAWGGLGRP